MFSCENFDDGAYMLRVDFQIRCGGNVYNSYFLMAILMGLIYPLGVPCMYLFLLYRKRTRLNPQYFITDDEIQLDEDEVIKSYIKIITNYLSLNNGPSKGFTGTITLWVLKQIISLGPPKPLL